jgi:hypothetical protein
MVETLNCETSQIHDPVGTQSPATGNGREASTLTGQSTPD